MQLYLLNFFFLSLSDGQLDTSHNRLISGTLNSVNVFGSTAILLLLLIPLLASTANEPERNSQHRMGFKFFGQHFSLSTLFTQSSIRCSVLLTKKEVEICSKLRNLIMYTMMWNYIRYESYVLVQDHLISFSKMTIYPRIDMERGTSSYIRGKKY